MKRTTLLLILLLCAVVPVSAQSDPPKGHFFAGYVFNRMDVDGKLDSGFDVPNHDALNTNGFNVAFGAHLGNSGVTDDISIVFDGAGHFSKLDTLSGEDNYLQLWTLALGPQFQSRRHHLLHPFVRAMFGVSHLRTRVDGLKVSDTGFAFIGGGGLDIQLGDVAAWRVIQLDYMLNRHDSESLNSFRVATGIAFHW